MLSPQIESQILNELSFLVASFKSLNKALTYLKTINNIPLGIDKRRLSTVEYTKLLQHIKLLLDYKNNILIISPWAIKFNFNELNLMTNENIEIDVNQPYEVYDRNNNLIYVCEGHNGIYGLSQLDKWLIQKSKNMSTYYLKYKDIQGHTHIFLLVVNLASEKTLNSNPYYNPPKEYEQGGSIIIVNNSALDAKVYTLYKSPSSFINTSSIKLSGEEITIRPSNQYILNSLDNPFWLFFDSEITVTKSIELPEETDIIIPVIINSLYYIATNSNPELINNTFNTNLTTTTKFDSEELILI